MVHFLPRYIAPLPWKGARIDMTNAGAVSIWCWSDAESPYTLIVHKESGDERLPITIRTKGRYTLPGRIELSMVGGVGGIFSISGSYPEHTEDSNYAEQSSPDSSQQHRDSDGM